MPTKTKDLCQASVSPLAASMGWGLGCSAQQIQTHRIVVPAGEASEKGQGAWGVKLNDSGSVVLYHRVLVEDDGLGFPHSQLIAFSLCPRRST